MEQKFFVCKTCGNIIAMVKNAGVPVMCCGAKMTEIIPGTTEAATEKHIPVVEIEDSIVKVTVGSVLHPMEEAHYIEWIYLETSNGIKRVKLRPGEEPIANFALLKDESVISAYAYCNLHGLWIKELK